MNPTRIYSLRLLYSLLLLPFAAFAILAILHELMFPGATFSDAPVVFLIWLVLFGVVHLVLTWAGERRFHALDRQGWQLLQIDDQAGVHLIFGQMDKLLRGGLLSTRKRADLERVLLRRYFPFLQQHVNEKRYRQDLLTCLRLGIRERDAFDTLKAYLLEHRQLTVELVDLAERLHEHRPDDGDIVEFMVHRYLEDRQRHYRAEYFYRQALAADQPEHVPAILDLCLPRALQQKRNDSFAGWLYLRSDQRQKGSEDAELAQQLYRCYEHLRRSGHHDALVAALASRVAEFDEAQVAAWQEAEMQRRERQLSARLARGWYAVQQRWLLLWGEIKRHRRPVYASLAIIAFLGLIYLLLPVRRDDADSLAGVIEAAEPEIDARFSLQVAAVKNGASAGAEVERLNKLGLDAYLIRPAGRSTYYRIRVGRFATKDSALSEGERLRREQVIRDFFVVNYTTETGSEAASNRSTNNRP